jgi:putative ABC transport system permease protein
MNKKRIALIVGLVIILLAIFFFQKSLINNFSLKSERIELYFDMNNEILPFILSEEQYIGERYKYALYIEEETVLKEKPLIVTGIDKNYYELEPMELIYGENTFSNENQIIISDRLAKKSYGTVNPIGKNIKIEDKNYEIIGIYKTNENNIFSRDKKDVAYIDYEYAKNSLNNYISIISIQKPANSKEEFFKEKFIDYLKFRIPDLNEEMLNIMDYSDTNRVLIEWHRGTKLFIASLSFILIATIFLKKIKIINKHVKKDLEIYYPKEIISLRVNEILEEAIKLVLLIFGGIFLLQWIIKFQFNIPGKYLPANDIFDFKFYRTLKNPVKMNISSYGYFYDITLDKVKLLTLGFFILAIITFLLIIKMANNKLLRGRDKCGKGSI